MSGEIYSIYITVDTTGAITSVDSLGKNVETTVDKIKKSFTSFSEIINHLVNKEIEKTVSAVHEVSDAWNNVAGSGMAEHIRLLKEIPKNYVEMERVGVFTIHKMTEEAKAYNAELDAMRRHSEGLDVYDVSSPSAGKKSVTRRRRSGLSGSVQGGDPFSIVSYDENVSQYSRVLDKQREAYFSNVIKQEKMEENSIRKIEKQRADIFKKISDQSEKQINKEENLKQDSLKRLLRDKDNKDSLQEEKNKNDIIKEMVENQNKLLQARERSDRMLDKSNANIKKQEEEKINQLLEENRLYLKNLEYLGKTESQIRKNESAERKQIIDSWKERTVSNNSQQSIKDLGLIEQGVNRIRRAFVGVGLYMGIYTIQAWARAGVQDLLELEKGMAKLKAITGSSAMEMKSMGAIARDMGLNTEYAASKATEAMVQLGQAGFTAKETMISLPDVLNLSTIGMMDIEKATIVTANIMEEFGLKAQDTSRIVDVMAMTSVKTVADVKGLANAFTYIGPIAASLGISVEQTAAALGTLTDAGLKSDRAGTSLRKIMDELSRSSSKLASAAKKLGIEEDELIIKNGNLFQIMEKLGSLSPSTLMDLFGVRGGTGAVALSRMTKSATDLYVELNKASSYSKVMADIMRDNVATSFERLISTLKEVIYQLGDSGLVGALDSVFKVGAGTIRVLIGVGSASDESNMPVKILTKSVEGLVGVLTALAFIQVPSVLLLLSNVAKRLNPTVAIVSTIVGIVSAFHDEIGNFIFAFDKDTKNVLQGIVKLNKEVPELTEKIAALGGFKNKDGSQLEMLQKYMQDLKNIAPDLAKNFENLTDGTNEWADAAERVSYSLEKSLKQAKMNDLKSELSKLEQKQKDLMSANNFDYTGNLVLRPEEQNQMKSNINVAIEKNTQKIREAKQKIIDINREEQDALSELLYVPDWLDELAYETTQSMNKVFDQDSMDKAIQRLDDFNAKVTDQLEVLQDRLKISSQVSGSWGKQESEILSRYTKEENAYAKQFRELMQDKKGKNLTEEQMGIAQSNYDKLIGAMKKEKEEEIVRAKQEYYKKQNEDYSSYMDTMNDMTKQSYEEILDMIDYSNSRQEDRIKASAERKISTLKRSFEKEKTSRVWEDNQLLDMEKETSGAIVAIRARADAEIMESKKKRLIDEQISYKEMFTKESSMLLDYETRKSALQISKFSGQRNEYEGEMSIVNAYEQKNKQLELEVSILQDKMALSADPALDRASIDQKNREIQRNIEMQKKELEDYKNKGTVWDGATGAMWDYQNEALKTAENVKKAFTDAFKGMEDLFVEFTTTGRMSFGQFTNQIISDIMRIAYQQSIGGLFEDLLSGGTGGVGFLAKLFGGKKALGGSVETGKAYLVGENGPELFMPSNMGSIVPNGKYGGNMTTMKANTQIQVTNNYYTDSNGNTKTSSTTYKRSMEPSDKQLMNRLAKTLQGVS